MKPWTGSCATARDPVRAFKTQTAGSLLLAAAPAQAAPAFTDAQTNLNP